MLFLVLEQDREGRQVLRLLLRGPPSDTSGVINYSFVRFRATSNSRTLEPPPIEGIEPETTVEPQKARVRLLCKASKIHGKPL